MFWKTQPLTANMRGHKYQTYAISVTLFECFAMELILFPIKCPS